MPARTHALYQPLCELILRDHSDSLPDLGNIQVIVPTSKACNGLRLTLLDALDSTHRALIPPACATLRSWIDRLVPAPPGITVLNEPQRLLLFTDALSQHPDLFQQENKWQVATALLQLFDELWLHQVSLPEQPDDWQQQLQNAYQAESINRHMSQEAVMVHTLWLAWQQQLADEKMQDPVQRYAERLSRAPGLIQSGHCYITTTDHTPIEQAFIDHLVAAGKATLAAPYCDEQSGGANRIFIDACFDISEQLISRASRHTASHKPDIALYRSTSIDTEIAAISLQLGNWLADGMQDIAVICEDRKLSRRLRAVLEQQGIDLQDDAGWFLSTTSAASVIERWLECIESDFDQRPLLDLLKSSFVFPHKDEQALEAVFRFERDLIRNENISSNLQRYRHQLQKRADWLIDRLHWPADSYRLLDELLQQLEQAALELTRMRDSDDTPSAATWLHACLDSLQSLGITDSLPADAAGMQLIDKLRCLHSSAAICSTGFDWHDFRYYLSSQLEQELFKPASTGSGICLMTLEQSQHQDFDAVIIAAAENNAFPGSAPASPFFNQAVRASLSLSDWQQFRAQRLRRFQQALYADIPYLITCRGEDDGEPVQPSPWIQALKQFYRLCYQQDMQTDVFDAFYDDELDSADISNSQQRARITLHSEQIPPRISTSSHQRLIDCPYKYFAADVLRLRTAEEIITELQKSGYGERVHSVLQAFHSQQPNLPAPFQQTITAANKDEAISCMNQISQAVFRFDMEDNALHRGWLQRWQQHIPAYIDWQMRRQQDWQVSATEQQSERHIDEHHRLYGRLDRIDQSQHDESCGIIDYKTGKAPRLDDVMLGEDVQLSSYALLLDDASEVSYLELDKERSAVSDRTSVAGEELDSIKQQAELRLKQMLKRMSQGEELIAWGDEVTCSYCDFSGICRRNHWAVD